MKNQCDIFHFNVTMAHGPCLSQSLNNTWIFFYFFRWKNMWTTTTLGPFCQQAGTTIEALKSEDLPFNNVLLNGLTAWYWKFITLFPKKIYQLQTFSKFYKATWKLQGCHTIECCVQESTSDSLEIRQATQSKELTECLFTLGLNIFIETFT